MKDDRKNIRLTLQQRADKKLIEILESTTNPQNFIKEAIFNYYVDIKKAKKESMFLDIEVVGVYSKIKDTVKETINNDQVAKKKEIQKYDISNNFLLNVSKNYIAADDEFDETDEYKDDDLE